jgi:hypothetical protein
LISNFSLSAIFEVTTNLSFTFQYPPNFKKVFFISPGDTATRVKMITTRADDSLYAYTPSTTLPLIAGAIFGLSTILHLVMMIKKRTWFYTALTVGGISSSSFPSLTP